MKKVGEYDFEKLLGSGSFAQVFRGKHTKTGQIVAIKMISRDKIVNSSTEIEKREIPILKMLNHENIVRLIDNQKSQNNHYLIMEYCKYGDLDKYIKNYFGGKLPEQQAKRIMYDLFKAYQFLYQNNIMHRDLKLANILVGEGFVVKIADFGFAKILDQQDPKNMSVTVGSPITSAPEILLNVNNYNYKADIWSLGVILYQLVYGSASYPFTLQYSQLTLANLLPTIQKNQIYFPETNDISDLLKDLIQKLLVYDVDQRISIQDVLLHPWVKQQSQIQTNDVYEDQDCLILSSRILQNAYDQHQKIQQNIKQIEKIPEQKINKITQQQQQSKQQQQQQEKEKDIVQKDKIVVRNFVVKLHQIVKKEFGRIFNLIDHIVELAQNIEKYVEIDKKYLYSFITLIKACQLYHQLLLSNITLNYQNYNAQPLANINLKWFLEMYSNDNFLNNIQLKFDIIHQFTVQLRNKLNLESVKAQDTEEILIAGILAICENTALNDYLVEKHEIQEHYKICKGLIDLAYIKDISLKVNINLKEKEFSEIFEDFWIKLTKQDYNMLNEIDPQALDDQNIFEFKENEYQKNDDSKYDFLKNLNKVIADRFYDLNYL